MASLAAGCGEAPPAPTPLGDAGKLTPITSGEIRFLDLDLEAGQFFHLEVEQRGIDLTLVLMGPAGETVATVDSPNGAWGPEEMILLVPTTGRYRLEALSQGKAGSSGELSSKLVASRLPTARDRDLVAAEGAYRAGLASLPRKEASSAVTDLRQAVTTFRDLRLPRGEANALLGLSRALSAQQASEPAAALATQAAEMYLRVGDDRMAAVALRRAGSDRIRSQPRRAIEALKAAEQIYEKVQDVRGRGLAQWNLGGAYHSSGQLQLALSSYEQALASFISLSAARDEASLRADLALLLLDLDRPEEASREAGQALEGFRRLGAREQIGTALRISAEAALQRGVWSEAEEAIGESLKILRDTTSRRDLAASLQTLATLHRQRKNSAAAEAAYREALEISRQLEDRQSEAQLLLGLGYLQLQSGQAKNSVEQQTAALRLFLELGDRQGEASARVRGAEAWRDLGKTEEAWKLLEPALEIVEALRFETRRRDFRGSYFASRQEYFEIALDLLLRLDEQNHGSNFAPLALEIHERRLARELGEELATPTLQPTQELEAALVQESKIEVELGRWASLGVAEEAVREAEISSRLADLERIRGAIRDLELRARVPRVSSVPSLQSWREVLDADSVALVYALGETRSAVWVLSRQGIVWRILPPRRELEAMVSDFTRRIRLRRRSQQASVRRLGRRLGEALLGPVRSELGDHRLILIPHGALEGLPWAAVGDPGSEGETYLLERHEPIVLPSLGSLEALRRRALSLKRSETLLAVFADPLLSPPEAKHSLLQEISPNDFGPGHDREDLLRSADELGLNPWARLPHSRQEAQAILALAPPGPHLLALGPAASRETVENGGLGRFTVLHFATHGLLHPERPELSGLVLSQYDESGRARNGFLRAFEIRRLGLTAELVVLSACESGIGKELRGEGMLSLTRAFLEGGASGVVASSWQVSDSATSILMQRFYQGFFTRKQTPAAALRAAQLSLLNESDYSQPFYWAAFFYQGATLPGTNLN